MKMHRYLFGILILTYVNVVALEIHVYKSSWAKWAEHTNEHDDSFGTFTTLLVMVAGAYLLLLILNALLLFKRKQRTTILLASIIMALLPILLFYYSI